MVSCSHGWHPVALWVQSCSAVQASLGVTVSCHTLLCLVQLTPRLFIAYSSVTPSGHCLQLGLAACVASPIQNEGGWWVWRQAVNPFPSPQVEASFFLLSKVLWWKKAFLWYQKCLVVGEGWLRADVSNIAGVKGWWGKSCSKCSLWFCN